LNRNRFQYGSHDAAVRDSQIATSSQVYGRAQFLPAGLGLGLGRDFAMTQEEFPPWRTSFIISNTALIASSAVQSPKFGLAIQTLPQYPQDQVWSFVFVPAQVVVATPTANVIQFASTFPQQSQEQLGSFSFFAPAFLPTAAVQIPSVKVDAEDLGNGQVQLQWSASPGATGYRLYINGVPQPTVLTQRTLLVTGLTQGVSYTFAVVAVIGQTDSTGAAFSVDDSILSNVIPAEHGVNENMYVFKYPWGNNPVIGYHIKYKLGDKV
jgi:hypothetical protein